MRIAITSWKSALALLTGLLVQAGCSESETKPAASVPPMVAGDKADLIRQLRAEDIAVTDEFRAPAGAAARADPPSAAEFWERAMKDPSKQQVQESDSDEVAEWMSLHGAEIEMMEIFNDPSLSALGDTTDPEEIRIRNRDNAQTMEALLNGAPDAVKRRYSSP